MKVYAADSPGGYQLVGRTIDNIWDPSAATGTKQFIFRVFDRISFYPITEAELDAAQASETQRDLVHFEDGILDLVVHETWANDNREDIAETAAQRARAIEAVPFLGELTRPHEADDAAPGESEWAGGKKEDNEAGEEDGCERVKAGIPGRCWRLLVKEGDKVEAGSVVVSFSFLSQRHSCRPGLFLLFGYHTVWDCTNRLLFPPRPTSSRARWRS